MRIRTKLTILFLAITLVPLSLLTGVDTYVLNRLGRDVASEMRENLVVMAQEQVESSLAHYVDVVKLEGKMAQLAGVTPPMPGKGTGHSDVMEQMKGRSKDLGLNPVNDVSGVKLGDKGPVSVQVLSGMLARPHMKEMVVLIVAPGFREGEFRVITEISQEVKSEYWLPGGADYTFEPDSEAVLESVSRVMAEKGSGTFNASYRGQQCAWAYRNVFGQKMAFMILPLARVNAISDHAQASILHATDITLLNTAGLGAVGILMVSFLALVASRKVTIPIELLSNAANRVAKGDFDARAAIPGDDELSRLGKTFDSMVPKLQNQMNMQQALELASEVQQRLLPSEFPIVDGLDIAGISIPCDETGGDYYDFLGGGKSAPGRATVVVGDVTGHGVSAALLMATARGMLRAAGNGNGDFSHRISKVNDLLCEDLGDTGQFMTLFAMELDRRGGTVNYVRAGHDPAMLYDPATDAFSELKGHPGPLLGIMPEFEYTPMTHSDLAQGQVLLVGTDGIWESFNKAKELYGKERLQEVVRLNHALSAQELLEAILKSVEDYREGTPAEDDTTLVVVKFIPALLSGQQDPLPDRRAQVSSSA